MREKGEDWLAKRFEFARRIGARNADAESHLRVNRRIVRNTAWVNYLGLCAITMPVGLGSPPPRGRRSRRTSRNRRAETMPVILSGDTQPQIVTYSRLACETR
jgi:hypothetical protein